MADDDESSMIGYDPLAWLHEETGSMPKTGMMDGELSTSQGDVVGSIFGSSQSNPSSRVDSEVEPHSSLEELNDELQLMESGFAEYSASNNESIGIVENQVVLDSIQSIQNVTLLHQKLLHILDTQEKIDIDASAVTQIDTATLQLLLVLKLSAVKLQKEVNIDFPSQKFIDAAYLLGLAEMLSVDQTASGLF